MRRSVNCLRRPRAGTRLQSLSAGRAPGSGTLLGGSPPRAILPTHEQATAASRNNMLARITQVVPGWAREVVYIGRRCLRWRWWPDYIRLWSWDWFLRHRCVK
jgi:hypothetical protein